MSPSRRLPAGGLALTAAGLAYAVSATGSGAARSPAREPIVIAHRGASAYRPEETLHAYELAVEYIVDVHSWTVRPENAFLPVEYRQGDPASPAFMRAEGDASRYLADLYELGVDGVFSDDVALAVSTRHRVFDR